MKTVPKFVFSENALEKIDEAGNCFVYFFSASTVATIAKMSEMLLWPTRWTNYNGQIPPIAWRIYRELNMDACTLQELGEIIGEAVSCSVVVNNNNGCCGNVGDVLPDGTIIQPPLQPPNPDWEGELGGDIEDGGGGLTDSLEICKLAYACWEYQGVILDILVKLDGGLLVLGIVAAIVAAFLPETWAVLIAGASAVSLTAVLSSLAETAAVIFGASGAIDNLFAQKDDIICEFANSLGGTAVDVENQFETAMLAVYGSLVNDELMADIIRITEASGIADWIAERVFDNGDFQPLDFPEGYECCPQAAGLWAVTRGDSGYCAADVAVVEPVSTFSPHIVGSVTKLTSKGSYTLYVDWDLDSGQFEAGDYTVFIDDGLTCQLQWERGNDSASYDVTDTGVSVTIPSDIELLRIFYGLGRYTNDCPQYADFTVTFVAAGGE